MWSDWITKDVVGIRGRYGMGFGVQNRVLTDRRTIEPINSFLHSRFTTLR